MQILRPQEKPNFKEEKRFWRQGYKFVAGADEVGRGCFAGPVVAGCVVFSPKSYRLGNIRIDDSKKLSPEQRRVASFWIKENALAWGIGEANVSLINRIGLGKATKAAFRRAIKAVNKKLDFLLIDAFYVPYVRGLRRKNQMAIIDGDEKSITVAGASIVAKVYRDALMRKLSHKYSKYGWTRNKGYGTKEHLRALREYGLTRYHRKQFVATYFRKISSSQARLDA